ncbi:MAG: SPFH domain-containing protein [Blautia obeum]|nr:SPFH domain-containing protein [Blautia obeum]
MIGKEYYDKEEKKMALFKRNPNEADYYGGKKHFIDVIKNNGANTYLFWRQPEEDFNTHSKLIVMPGETAIFVEGGNIVQQFSEGTYELTTNNYPFISRLKNALSGGISTFHCVIYFLKNADSMELKWGTDDPIQVRDKVYGIRTSVQARGSYKVRIENPALFLEKLIGNNVRGLNQNELNKYFKNEMLMQIKSCVSKFLLLYENEFIGIGAYAGEISEAIQPQINETVSKYGLRCVNFAISYMEPDQTKYDAIDEAQIERIKREKQGIGENAFMNQLGSNWDKMERASIIETLAQNEGAGNITAMGAGLGMAMGVGSTIGNMANQVFQNASETQNMQSYEDPIVVLEKLKKLLAAGLITEEDYDTKKKEVLSRM